MIRRRRRQESPVSGETTKETVKTIRAGNAGSFRPTCGDYARVLFVFAREAAGAPSTRHSLRPLSSGATHRQAPGAICAAGTRNCAYLTSLRGARRRSNQASLVLSWPGCPWLVPAIQVFISRKGKQDVDHRDEPGDDGLIVEAIRIASRSLSSGAHSRDPLARNDYQRVRQLNIKIGTKKLSVPRPFTRLPSGRNRIGDREWKIRAIAG